MMRVLLLMKCHRKCGGSSERKEEKEGEGATEMHTNVSSGELCSISCHHLNRCSYIADHRASLLQSSPKVCCSTVLR